MQDFKHFDPKQAAMDEARGLLEAAARAAMADGSLPEKELPAFVVEVPNDVKNGDLASNFAMAGARVFGMPPRKIAEAVAAAMPALEETHFSRVEIAGPGFINLFLAPGWFADVVLAANAAGADYGRTSYGKGEKVNVEFVSANPTGPMHLGNARGGALGDCLAAAMDWAGYDVTREFLINDAGNQILKFGKSLAVRYLQIFRGEDAVSFPEDCYQGADIRVLAQKFADVHGNVYMEKPFEELQKDIAAFALPLNVQGLKDDMAKYRVHYDVWFSETTLHESGAIREMLDKLAERGATYEKDGAIWYRSMQYAEKYGGNKVTRKGLDGEVTDEDKDEVLVRANGVPTYFAADIAYHYNKFAVRGFSRAIDVWGADHHGHVARMKGAMDAIGLDGEKLDIVPTFATQASAYVSQNLVLNLLDWNGVNLLNEYGSGIVEAVGEEQAYGGQITGFAGLVGAGRTETMRAIFGADRLDSGEIYVKGEKVHIRTPKDAIKKKIAFLTEDRKGQGLVLSLDVRTNLILANMKGFSNGPFLNKGKIEKSGQDNVESLRIKTPSLDEVTAQLSGGNQQKVVIGKWVNTDADIFIFDEPTRGIDVGAKIEVYHVMNDLVKAGKCVIMVSSELPEILAMSDHVVVMRGGRVMANIDRDTPHFNSEDIMKAAWGGELD